MHSIEHAWVFYANRREVVHIKKAAVIDFVGSNTPVRESIPLLVEKFLELIETFRVTLLSINLGEGMIERSPHAGRRPNQLLKTPGCDFLLAIPLVHRGGVATRANR